VNAHPKKSEGGTALQIAAEKGFVPIARTLLSAGADVNAPGSQRGGTALEQAAKFGRVDMIQLLVQHGTQLIGPGVAQFERAKQLATENRHYTACRLLESLHDEQISTFNIEPRDIMRMPPCEFSVSEDQGDQTENPDIAQNGALRDLSWSSLSQNDFVFNTGTLDGEIINSADLSTLTEFNSFNDF
jgi:hypothetical protein